MDEVADQDNPKKAVDTYDHFLGAELCLSDELGRKIMVGYTKRVKANEGNPRGTWYPILYEDNSLYYVSFTNGWTE